MKIIYPTTEGLAQLIPAPKFLATLTGTEEEKLIHLANKDLPTGTPYEITDEDLDDRTFRDAWEYVAGSTEKISDNLSLDDQLKYNHITQEVYDANES
jgi:long-subunit fatty acid transport protein